MVSLASIEPTMPMQLQLFKDGNTQMKLHGKLVWLAFSFIFKRKWVVLINCFL